MPTEVLNWNYEAPRWSSSDQGKRPGVLKNTTENMRGLTRRFYDEDRSVAAYRRDRQWTKLGFDVPSGSPACMNIGNGAVYPRQYYPSRPRDVKLESSLRRQGTNPSLATLGFDGPEGLSSACAAPMLGGPLLASYTINDGRSQLMADYDERRGRFTFDESPFVHTLSSRQSIYESVADPTKQAFVSQNEIKSLYPVLHSPGQSAPKSAYSVSN